MFLHQNASDWLVALVSGLRKPRHTRTLVLKAIKLKEVFGYHAYRITYIVINGLGLIFGTTVLLGCQAIEKIIEGCFHWRYGLSCLHLCFGGVNPPANKKPAR
jgi:hypothetical protein